MRRGAGLFARDWGCKIGLQRRQRSRDGEDRGGWRGGLHAYGAGQLGTSQARNQALQLTLSSVDLPLPLGPTMASLSPALQGEWKWPAGGIGRASEEVDETEAERGCAGSAGGWEFGAGGFPAVWLKPT